MLSFLCATKQSWNRTVCGKADRRHGIWSTGGRCATNVGAAQSFGPRAERGGGTGRAALRSCDLVLFWKQWTCWNKAQGLGGWFEAGVIRRLWQGRVPGARQGRRSETWGKGGTWEWTLSIMRRCSSQHHFRCGAGMEVWGLGLRRATRWAELQRVPGREALPQQCSCSRGAGWALGLEGRLPGPAVLMAGDRTGTGTVARARWEHRTAQPRGYGMLERPDLVLCPHNDKEEGESKNPHWASGNMLCPMILPGNTWQNMGCCLQWFVSSGNNMSEGPKTVISAPQSKAGDCSLIIYFSLWQSWFNNLSFFPFPLFLLLCWRVAFNISSAMGQVTFPNYFKLQNWKSSWHHYCCLYYCYAFSFSKICHFPNLKSKYELYTPYYKLKFTI